jgi:hypothetical protein
LAEISKLSKVAIADVAKVDAVLKADIANFNGLTIPAAGINPTPATSGFLFTYSGAAVAYSVRQLNNNATQIMRVRRASDNVEADVGFDTNDELSLTSPISTTSDGLSYTDFSDFVDHTGTPTDAFVRTWYDQTGLQFHAEQSTSTAQPQIYDASTGFVLVESGGKPALFCADSTDGFNATAGAIDVTARTIYQWSVYSLTGVGNYPTITPSALYEGHNVGTEIPRTGTNRTTFTGVNAASAINTNQAYLRHSYADTTDFKTFLDGSGTAIISGTDTNADWASSGLQIFDKFVGATGEIKLSEFVMWQSQPSNVTGINNNINAHFSIY